VNISRPSAVRIAARSVSGTGQSRGNPASALACSKRRASSMRHVVGPLTILYGDEVLLDRVGVRVPALPEQRQHLPLADLPASQPHPGGLCAWPRGS